MQLQCGLKFEYEIDGFYSHTNEVQRIAFDY